jgi:membrane protease YdiL (CAAX protease family)
MTTIPEFDPNNPNPVSPTGEPQPWKDDEDEIPSFEGMVFSSYVDPADLAGGDWESAQPIPEMPLTIWEEPPLTEDKVLKVIANSSQNSVAAGGSSDVPGRDEPEQNEPGRDEREEPADSASDWLQPPAPLAENLPAPGREPLNGPRRGLYGNLADSSWLTLDKLHPVQGLPGEEFVEQTPFYTRDVEELSSVEQASDPLSVAQDEPMTSAEAPREEPQPVALSTEATPSPVEPSAEPSLPQLGTAETHGRGTEPELIDAVIPMLSERPLFHSWYEPEPRAADPTRIPHFGHLAILAVIGFAGLVGSILLMRGALYFQLFGVSTVQQASADIHYTIGFMAGLYLISFGLAALIFPLVWHESLFAGLQWNFASARRRIWILLGAAFVCFLLAMVDEVVLPGPTNAPIDKLFDSRAAAWLMFAFGVTVAPFFEEIAFRGFLLPALCTALDWYGEKLTGETAAPLDASGHPCWSITAMALASIATSIPFALMHAEQTAWSLGPFLLLVAVSLVLCWARLATRSLAASVIVHASYNLLLFSLMLLGTGGFRHLDKM